MAAANAPPANIVGGKAQNGGSAAKVPTDMSTTQKKTIHGE